MSERSAAAWLDEVRGFEARGEHLLAYDAATRGLAQHDGDPALAHRAVLALARGGATRRAAAEYVRLGLDRRPERDAAALGARIAKDAALAAPPAERAAKLARAADLYEAVWRRERDSYTGVNVATLRLLAGDSAAARAAADAVLAASPHSASGEAAYYGAASEAEAALVRGDEARAGRALERAAALQADRAQRATTRRQLRLVCRARGLDEAILRPLAPPATVHFAGHRIAAPGAKGRFPAAAEGEVAAKIARPLDLRGVGYGYGALASGADVMIAEALLARGGELHVVLPFALDEFRAASVAPAGASWLARSESCLARAASVTMATEDRYLGHDSLFAYGSHLAMGLAVLRAEFLDGEARQLAVWDGRPPEGPAGTAADVVAWRAMGRAGDVIASGGDGGAPTASPAPAGRGREPRAMLFGDVRGFSKLGDSEIPAFVSTVFGAFARVLGESGRRVLWRNTWGDGLYVVLDDAPEAARC